MDSPPLKMNNFGTLHPISKRSIVIESYRSPLRFIFDDHQRRQALSSPKKLISTTASSFSMESFFLKTFNFGTVHPISKRSIVPESYGSPLHFMFNDHQRRQALSSPKKYISTRKSIFRSSLHDFSWNYFSRRSITLEPCVRFSKAQLLLKAINLLYISYLRVSNVNRP